MSEPGKAVFLSYASQDAEAVKRICEALRAAGVEVWFDQAELVGGDAWDAKIRKQIAECALFVPVISAGTQARLEGYFRIEWKLAARRTHAMATAKAFLLPIVIDDTRDTEAHVPDEFRDVQWTRLPVQQAQGGPDGETSARFTEQIKRLLTPSIEVVGRDRRIPPSGIEAASPAGFGDPALQRKRFSAAWIAAGVAALALVGFFALRPQPNAGAETRPPTAGQSTAPLTEAQKRVAQARQLYEDGDELDRENLLLAEDLVKQAQALDNAEPTAWELGAAISYTMVWHSIDLSPARKELLMRQATRAVALAPQSVAARLALANARMGLIFTTASWAQNSETGELERELRGLAEREPKNWRVQRALGMVYRLLNRSDDAVRAHQAEVELAQGQPIAVADLVNVLVRRNRFAEAEPLVAAALARQPTGRLRTFDLLLKIRWRGDLAAARSALAAWPAWLLQNDRAAFYAWQVWLFSGQAQSALAVAQRVPRDYLRDNIFSGPRAVLTARAHERAGNTEATQADWRTVVQHADRELASSPEETGALYWKAWALARLGDAPAARAIGALLRQRNSTSLAGFFSATSIVPLWATLGETDLAFAGLTNGGGIGLYDGFELTRAMLELDPAYDPLRADPRFQAVLKAASAPEPSASAPTAPPVAKSLAVLPFRTLSSDPENDFLAEAISEELCGALGRVRGLRVAAMASSASFKGRRATPADMGTQLGVTYLVDGTVQKIGNRVRVRAQLIQAADGFPLWASETIEHDVKDAFAVQDAVVASVTKNLQMQLSGTVPPATINPAAYRAYMDARRAWTQRATPEFVAQALQLYRQAISLDPKLGRAYAGLADAMRDGSRSDNRLNFGDRDGAEARELLALTAKALELEPQSAEAHTARSAVCFQLWRFAEAETEARTAIELNPNFAEARLYLGRVLQLDGRVEEALAEVQLAAELDPLTSRIHDNAGAMLLEAGRPQAALASLERALALQPDSRQAATFKMEALSALGRHEEAQAIARGEMFRTRPVVQVVEVLVAAGRREEAERVYGELIKGQPDRRFVTGLAWLGRAPEVLETLRLDVVRVTGVTVFFYDPAFDAIRQDPRFIAFLSQLGLKEAHDRAQRWRAAQRKPAAAAPR